MLKVALGENKGFVAPGELGESTTLSAGLKAIDSWDGVGKPRIPTLTSWDGAEAPLVSPRPRRRPGGPSAEVEARLLRHHEQDRAQVRALFGGESVPPRQRHLINTASPAEGLFLASFLGIPATNVVKIKTNGFAANNRVARTLHACLDEYLRQSEATLAGGSVTLLGHMSWNASRTEPLLARLPAWQLHQVLRPLEDSQPSYVNFFSCSSIDYSRLLADCFAQEGYLIPHRTAVRDEVEISQWPKRAQRGKPLRLFYAGPEIGASAPTFQADLHGPILPTFITE